MQHVQNLHELKARQPVNSAVYAGLTNVTNRHTDHTTPSVALTACDAA